MSESSMMVDVPSGLLCRSPLEWNLGFRKLNIALSDCSIVLVGFPSVARRIFPYARYSHLFSASRRGYGYETCEWRLKAFAYGVQ